MLSKTEREYLQGNFIPTNAHKRVLNHKIRKKLSRKGKLPNFYFRFNFCLEYSYFF